MSNGPLFQLVLVLKVYRPLQCLVNVNYRGLICCACHFQSCSLFFILASSVCRSLQCLISALTQGAEGGHLFRSTCSVVLWGGRNTAKQISLACVGSAHSVWTTWFALAHSSVCFPGLHCSGSRLLYSGTVQSGPCVFSTSQV